MKQIFTTFISMLLVSAAFAQNSAEAKSILDKAYSTYETSNGIELTFKSVSLESTGTAYPTQSGTAMIKGNKFKIEMDALDTWFDGKTQWVLMKDLNEVNVSNPSTEEIASISPLALLSMYKNGYTLKKPVTKPVNGKEAQVIEMVPIESKSEFKTISVAIDKKNNTVLQVNITMKNGLKNKIDITGYNANYMFPDTHFVFDKAKYPKVEIIDLR